jgi:hypothetical protein
MKKNNSNNLILIGAPYLLGEKKINLWSAIISVGGLPVTTGIDTPLSNEAEYLRESEVFQETLLSGLEKCTCYLLFIGKINKLPTATYKEIDIVRSSGKPVILIHSNSEECRRVAIDVSKQLTNNNLQVVIFEESGGDLEKSIIASLKTFFTVEEPWLQKHPKIPSIQSFKGKDSFFLQGFYYSALDLTVKSYWVEIFHTTSEVFANSKAFLAREKGFHDYYRDTYYIGYAYIQSEYLHLDLYKEGGGDTLTIRVYAGLSLDELEKGKNIYFGTMQGTTSLQPKSSFCYKTALAWVGKEAQENKVEARPQISRLLSLRRKSFVSEETMMSLELAKQLAIGENIEVDRAKHITGIYRIWTLGTNKKREKGITQSKMTIYEDYTCRVENPIFPDIRQFCEINFCENISKVGRPKIFFIMRHEKYDRANRKGLGQITSVAITDLPIDSQTKDIGSLFVGAFCSAGQSPVDIKPNNTYRQVRGGFFMAILEHKQVLTEPSCFIAEFLNVKQIKLLGGNYYLHYKKLLKENKRDNLRNKKRRVVTRKN